MGTFGTFRRIALVWITVALGFAWATVTAAQDPQRSSCQFPVNSSVKGRQVQPSVVFGPDGGFFAVWSGEHLDGHDIFARRFDPDGQELGPDVLLNEATLSDQQDPAVDVDGSGDFWVTWTTEDGQDGDGASVHMRRVTAEATLEPDEVQVNATTLGDQSGARVAIDGHSAMVVWQSEGQDGDGTAVVSRLRQLPGPFVAPEVQVNEYTDGDQGEPAVAEHPDGGFLVTWSGEGAGDGSGIFVRRLAADGTALGSEVQVNGQTAGEQSAPDVEALGTGFLVVWQSRADPEEKSTIRARRLDLSGQPTAPEVDVPETAVSPRWDRKDPDVAAVDGEFVVAWSSQAVEEYYYNTVAYGYAAGRRVDAQGTPVGSDFGIAGTSDYCFYPQCDKLLEAELAAAPTPGDFVVVWGNDQTPSGDYFGVGGQRFGGPDSVLQADLGVEIDENADPIESENDLVYSISSVNHSVCPAEDAFIDLQLPDQEFVSVTGFAWSCESTGADTARCSGRARQGKNQIGRVRVNLPDVVTVVTGLEATIESSTHVDPDLSNNVDSESTQVLVCYDLELTHEGKGEAPTTLPRFTSPCNSGRRLPIGMGVLGNPAPGWRVTGWTGTDDDGSLARRNDLTMPKAAHTVGVSYGIPGLIAWWTGDNESTDLLGNHDLEVNGTFYGSGGAEGRAFEFRGDGFLEAPSDPGLDLGGDDFSLGFWIRTSSDTGTQALLDRRSDAPERGFHVFLSDGRPGLRLADGTAAIEVVGSAGLADGELHHVVFVVDRDAPDGIRIFVDGRLDTLSDPTGAGGSLSTEVPLVLGRRSADFGADAFYDGLLDEVWIRRGALGAIRILELFGVLSSWTGQGNALDSTARENHGVLEGTAGYLPAACGLGFHLPADGNRIRIPDATELDFLGEDWTFAAWIRASSADDQTLASKVGAVDGRGYRIYLDQGRLAVRLVTNLSPREFVADNLPDLRDGDLHHVAVVIHRSFPRSVRFYVDGQFQELGSTSPIVWTPAYGQDLSFGGPGPGPEVMDEIRLSNRPMGELGIETLRLSCSRLPIFSDGFEGGGLGAWSSVFQ
ncbi:MAG: LamG-like jellyroll fold domain-containing protein [Acidobacteriota bacterium]